MFTKRSQLSVAGLLGLLAICVGCHARTAPKAPVPPAAKPPAPVQIPDKTPPAPRPRPQQPARSPEPQVAPPPVTGPLISGADLAKSSTQIQARVSDLRQRLSPYAASSNAGTKSAASRIESFLRLADLELQRGNLSQADSMADRAQTMLQALARE